NLEEKSSEMPERARTARIVRLTRQDAPAGRRGLQRAPFFLGARDLNWGVDRGSFPGGKGMVARQAAAKPTAAAEDRSLGGRWSWPQFFVRWLFGLGEELSRPELSAIPTARFQNICFSRETGAGAGQLAKLVGQRLGWKVYDDDFFEAIAH